MITLVKPGAITLDVSLQARPQIKAPCTAEADREITFTDTDFSPYVKAEFDANKDGKIMYSEVKNVQEINIYDTEIADLSGIAYFKLECGYTYLEALGLSRNTVLAYLDCQANQLSSLILPPGRDIEQTGLRRQQADSFGCEQMHGHHQPVLHRQFQPDTNPCLAGVRPRHPHHML